MHEMSMRSENNGIGSEYEDRWFSYKKKTSMDVNRALKFAYNWNCYTLKLVGIWPDERKWNRPSSYVVLIPFITLLCSACVPQTINLPIISDDFALVVENLSMANITSTISLLKIVIFWTHGKPLKSLLKCMNRDWSTVMDDTERETMIIIARITRNITIRSYGLIQIVIASFLILRLYAAKYTNNKLLYRGYFPYDVNTSPNYELTMLAQLIGILYEASSYTAVDTFLAMLVLHVCAQLANLKDQLKKLQTYDKKDLQTKLKMIVDKHVYLTRFVETIENCCNGMLLIQMLGCTVQLCFQIFQAIMSFSGMEKEYMMLQLVFLCLYVIYVMLQLYLYCYVGEKLMMESSELADAAYDSEWYNLSPRNARLLIIIMCRASTPLSITAGRFCSFSMLLYSQVLKTSMQYISVLCAMKFEEKH